MSESASTSPQQDGGTGVSPVDSTPLPCAGSAAAPLPGAGDGLSRIGWLCLSVFVVGAALLGNIYRGTIHVGGFEIQHILIWQGLYVVGFAGYVVVLWSLRRRPVRVRVILIAAVLLRLPLLFCEPNSDCNRYVWEGMIQGEGHNPFARGPNDEALTELRDDVVWPGINKKQYTTIYPPLAQLEFRLLAAIHYGIKSPQIMHALLDIGVVCALTAMLASMGCAAWQLAIYALCPLVLASFAHAGHNDPLMLLGVLGFLAAGHRKWWGLAGFALGCAILAKTTPAILLALLVRRSKLAIAVTLVTVAAGYLLYADAGKDLFAALLGFPGQSSFNNPFDQLRLWINHTWEPVLLARRRLYVVLGLLTLAAAYRAWRPRDLVCDARWLTAIVLLALPIVHFWYLSWIVVLIALKPRGYYAWLLLTGTMALYWMAEWRQLDGSRWKFPPWGVAAIWVPFLVSWAIERMTHTFGHSRNKPSKPGHVHKVTQKSS
jgi:hypothetical protein